MKTYRKRAKTLIKRTVYEEARSIEEIIRNALNNPNGIEESAPPMFTPRDSGVLPEYNIRTDKQLLAIEACDKFAKSQIAKREGIALANEQQQHEQEEGA